MLVFFRTLFVVTVLLVVGEVFTRNLVTTPSAVISDAELGWIYKPHTKIFHSIEGWAANTTNAMGFNDRDLQPEEKVTRVLVIGDSYTEALQVEQSVNYTSLVESQKQGLDVVNGGRAGLSPLQYPVLAKRFMEAAPISQVVMVLNPSDITDIGANEAELVRDASGQITEILLREQGLHWLRKMADVIFTHSALASYLKDRFKAAMKNNGSGVAPDPQRQCKLEQKTREVLAFVFAKINAEVPLAVLYIPKLEYLPYGVVRHDRKSAAFEKLIFEVARGVGVEARSARQFMASSYKTNHRPPVGFPNRNMVGGHLNETGHQSVAQALSALVRPYCTPNQKQAIAGVEL